MFIKFEFELDSGDIEGILKYETLLDTQPSVVLFLESRTDSRETKNV